MSFKKTFYQSVAYIKFLRNQSRLNGKIENLLRKNKSTPLNPQTRAKVKKLFAAYGFRNISLKWHTFYKDLHEEEVLEFIPENLFYSRIEQALNKGIMYPALEDKNLLDKFFPPSILPKTIVKNINGFYYVNDVQVPLDAAIQECCKKEAFVIKPTIGTNGGEGVKRIDLEDVMDCPGEITKLFAEYGADFIVQDILEQHPELAILNPTSINTIRVISYMREKEVVPLSAVLRIGRSGSFTDNWSLGGVACGVNKEGFLNTFAVDIYGGRYYKTDNGTPLQGVKIPHYEKILVAIKSLHRQLPYFRIISWDLLIDENSEVKMIEFNAMGQDINAHQMANGPLFGPYFNEILEIARNHDGLADLMKYGK